MQGLLVSRLYVNLTKAHRMYSSGADKQWPGGCKQRQQLLIGQGVSKASMTHEGRWLVALQRQSSCMRQGSAWGGGAVQGAGNYNAMHGQCKVWGRAVRCDAYGSMGRAVQCMGQGSPMLEPEQCTAQAALWQ